jgi:hypothetical protein
MILSASSLASYSSRISNAMGSRALRAERRALTSRRVADSRRIRVSPIRNALIRS